MKIALIGYGNMGREIESLIVENKKDEIVSISYKNISDSLDKEGIKKADVAIDFTSPEIILKNIEEVAKLGKNMVVGTTGWYDKIDDVKNIIEKYKIGLVYGQNFSIGANLFFKTVEYASSMINKFANYYDVYGFEIHHRGKKDSPSGTARKLSEIILKNYKNKNVLQTEKLDRKINDNELHFASVRGGVNPGLHEIIFDSEADEIKLIHSARGRKGFAQGSLVAAQFIKDKKGFYNFDQLFDFNLPGGFK
ncbi:4-hydroxy-tetrahydrodipicolinate reductase [Candidatus Microgenomates bacterium]|nr:MAG: 4-hydroxy-tetrahydrodipicolinate reductase [Candidatus Microgenomates bacterium]